MPPSLPLANIQVPPFEGWQPAGATRERIETAGPRSAVSRLIFCSWLRDADEQLKTLRSLSTCSVAWNMIRPHVVWLTFPPEAKRELERRAQAAASAILEAPFGVQSLHNRPPVEGGGAGAFNVWALVSEEIPSLFSTPPVMGWHQISSNVPHVADEKHDFLDTME